MTRNYLRFVEEKHPGHTSKNKAVLDFMTPTYNQEMSVHGAQLLRLLGLSGSFYDRSLSVFQLRMELIAENICFRPTGLFTAPTG